MGALDGWETVRGTAGGWVKNCDIVIRSWVPSFGCKKLSCAQALQPPQKKESETVHGQNPATVGLWSIPAFMRFHPCQLVQEFVHAQYTCPKCAVNCWGVVISYEYGCGQKLVPKMACPVEWKQGLKPAVHFLVVNLTYPYQVDLLWGNFQGSWHLPRLRHAALQAPPHSERLYTPKNPADRRGPCHPCASHSASSFLSKAVLSASMQAMDDRSSSITQRHPVSLMLLSADVILLKRVKPPRRRCKAIQGFPCNSSSQLAISVDFARETACSQSMQWELRINMNRGCPLEVGIPHLRGGTAPINRMGDGFNLSGVTRK